MVLEKYVKYAIDYLKNLVNFEYWIFIKNLF